MLRHPSSFLVALALAGTLLAGCDPSTGTEASPAEGDIVVVDNDFEPGDLEVAVGDTVTWVWDGRAPHNVVGEGFDSGVQSDGTFEHTFEEPGTYSYECTLHGGMTGEVTVVDR